MSVVKWSDTQGGGSSPVTLFERTLSAAELLTLNTAPIDLIPAPGPGKTLWPVSLVAKISQGTEAFNGMLELGFAGSPSTLLTGLMLMPSAMQLMCAMQITSMHVAINKPLRIQCLGGQTAQAPTVGSGTLDVTFLYSVIDTPLPVVTLTSAAMISCTTSSWTAEPTPAHPAIQYMEIWEGGIKVGWGNRSGDQLMGSWGTTPTLGSHTVSFKFYDASFGDNLLAELTNQSITVTE